MLNPIKYIKTGITEAEEKVKTTRDAIRTWLYIIIALLSVMVILNVLILFKVWRR